MGISLTAVSELGVSGTYGSQTQALQAAEAGLNHAASLIKNYKGNDFTELLGDRVGINEDYLTGNNPFVTAKAAKFTAGSIMIDEEVANKGYRLRDGITGAVVTPEAYYRVSLIDDEPGTSTALPRVPNFDPGVTYRENDNNPQVDKNHRLVVYSTGTYNNASVTLEGWIAFLPFPALSANGNITVSGNSTVEGVYGGIHSNSDLLLSSGGGNNWWVEQTFTATGQIVGDPVGHVGGFYGGLQERLELPPLVTVNPTPRIQDFLLRQADRLLIDPSLYQGAHESDPSGIGNDASATGRLRSLAQSLDLPYGLNDGSGSLVAAIDDDPASPHVQQGSAVAIAIKYNATTQRREAEKIADLSSTGWVYSGGTNANWSIPPNESGLQAGGHTFYVVGMDNYKPSSPSTSTKNGGNVKLTGNVGSGTDPNVGLQVTIMVTGSIEIDGTPNITANLKNLETPFLPPFIKINLLQVAVQDIKITGDNNSAIKFTGVSFAGEQVELSSSGDINGQIIAFSNPHVTNTPVVNNSISGRFNLTFNDGNSVGRLRLFSWRQIKR
jgi:hypothetical protein